MQLQALLFHHSCVNGGTLRLREPIVHFHTVTPALSLSTECESKLICEIFCTAALTETQVMNHTKVMYHLST